MASASESGADLGRAGRESVSGLTNALYQETLLALVTDTYLEGLVTTTAAGHSTVIPKRLLPNGRRAVGQWPGDDMEKEMLHVLDRLESAEVDPEKKGKFARLRNGIMDAGTDVFAKVMVEMMRTYGGRII